MEEKGGYISMRVVNILGTDKTVPYKLLEQHEIQIMSNHGQTLNQICDRGGLDWVELYCVLTDRDFDRRITLELAEVRVSKMIVSFLAKNKTIKLDLRPCIIKLEGDKNGFEVDAYFHRWCDKGMVIENSPEAVGIVNYTVGIIEYEDGTIDECHPKNIRFADRG